MLSQLVYVSSRKQSCNAAEIDKILMSCEKNNPSLDITGVLLYSDTKFIQLVEGDSKVIMELYEKIKKDSRHSKPVMVSYNPIQQKAFPSWHMGTRNISTKEMEFKTDIGREDQEIFNRILGGKEENGQKVLNLVKKFF